MASATRDDLRLPRVGNSRSLIIRGSAISFRYAFVPEKGVPEVGADKLLLTLAHCVWLKTLKPSNRNWIRVCQLLPQLSPGDSLDDGVHALKHGSTFLLEQKQELVHVFHTGAEVQRADAEIHFAF